MGCRTGCGYKGETGGPAGRCWMLSLAGCCGDEKDDLRVLGNLSWTGAMMAVEDLGLTGGFVDVLC